MDKIKSAKDMVDQLLDECNIRQVGDDKAALPDEPEELVDSMDDLNDYILDEAKPVTGYDLFKLRRGLGRKEYQDKQKAKKKGSVKESDQTKVAQQADTLFDNPERMVKDKTDKDPSLDPEPTTEGEIMVAKLIAARKAMGDKRFIKGKRSKSIAKESMSIKDKINEAWWNPVDSAKKAIANARDNVQSGRLKGKDTLSKISKRNKALEDAAQG